ncbi:MAG TPA: hypothetical protein VM324_02920 [Egibacteraceae bacterium]|nr:hypothetical protein [Egibacteraceae bacterium]
MSIIERAVSRRATTVAELAVDPAAGDGLFLPWGGRLPHFAEARAVCGRGESHAAPGAECDCGFTGAYDAVSLLDLIEPTIGELAGSAMLDLELTGTLRIDQSWTRAAEQRVMGGGVIRWCRRCRPGDVVAHGPARLYGAERTVGLRRMQGVVTRCDAHTDGATLTGYSLADLAGLLRTELTWAPEEVIAALVDRRRARLVLGQRRGPALGMRRIGQLRMGQVGFTSLDSLRLDGDGRLWVDVDGPAPQRALGDVLVPVHRAVDLAFELIVPVTAAERIDAAVGRPRPPLLGRREAEVRRIEGMEHLPSAGGGLGPGGPAVTGRWVAVAAEARCSVYRPGHRVHYIQARKSREDHGDGVACAVVELIEPDVVIVGFGKARHRWHNHDLPRLREALADLGPQAHIYERKNLLRLGNRCFCIAMPGGWDPDCDTGPNHGFVLRPR